MKGKKFLCMLLSALLVIGALAMFPARSGAAVGDANDGVNFTDGDGIYFGAYKHATALSYGYYDSGASLGVTYDGSRRPVLWNVMGEEETGKVTLLSRYVLDGYYFYHDYTKTSPENANIYDASDIRKWLNDTAYNRDDSSANTGTDSNTFKGFLYSGKIPFTAAELGNTINGPVMASSVTTSTYAYNTGDFVPGSAVTSAGDLFYLPWGTYYSGSYGDPNTVWWSANDGSGTRPTGYKLTDKSAKLRGGASSVDYWLRSPYSDYSSYALCVLDLGIVYNVDVINALGLRPAFKLNPSSVIFISEIVSGSPGTGQTAADYVDDSTPYNYAAATPGTNYKLTVLGSVAETLDGVPTTAQAFDKADGTMQLALAPSQTTAEYTVNYKIVGDGAGGREIAAYGEVPATAPTALDLDISALDNGKAYEAYVWLQKNNPINSNEALALQHFTLSNADKATLSEAIAAAEALRDGAAPGAGPGQHPQSAIDALDGAITAAQAVYGNPSATQQDVADALAALQSAVTAFNAAKIGGGGGSGGGGCDSGASGLLGMAALAMAALKRRGI
jgi:hypothetical protein